MTTPHDLGAEQTVLGAAMNSSEFPMPHLTADDFYDTRHAAIFTAITALRDAGEPCDPVPVAAKLAGDLPRIGGATYLHELFSNPVATGWHVNRVRGKAHLRRRVEQAARITQAATSPDADLARVDEMWAEYAATGIVGNNGPVRWDTIVEETNDALERTADTSTPTRAVRTGYIDFDRITSGGLKPGQLMVVAARPGVGKSVVATDLCRSAAFKQHVPTGLWSLEMNRVDVAKRIISAQYRIPYSHLTSALLADDDWVRLANASRMDSDAPLWIDDSSKQTLSSIRTNATRLHRQHNLGLIVVDYLQLMDAATGRRSDNRQQEVSNLSRGLKLLARELDLPVVFLAQLNRGPEQRHEKRPQLSDLRESGAIEQDADIVLLIHREDYYDNESPRAGEVDLIVAKNRGGPTDTVTVGGQLHFQRFVDMTLGEDLPGRAAFDRQAS